MDFGVFKISFVISHAATVGIFMANYTLDNVNELVLGIGSEVNEEVTI